MHSAEVSKLLAHLTAEEREELEKLLAEDVQTTFWRPLPGPQSMAFNSTADVVGYGGAAGGGKTDLALGKSLMHHHQVLIMRRESTQLHGAIERLAQMLRGDRSGYNSQAKIWRNCGPRKVQIEFGSAPNLGDEARYQGRDHDLLIFDEATAFLPSQIRYLSGWVRSTRPGVHSQMFLLFNPPTTPEGRWVLDFFAPWLVKGHPHAKLPGEIAYVASLPDENGESVDVWDVDERPFVLVDGERIHDFNESDFSPEQIITPSTRTFIPARIVDNPYLRDSGYLRQLQSLPEPLRSQLLYGAFDIEQKDSPYQLIPSAWVDAAMKRWHKRDRKPPMVSMGVDIARGGPDSTTIARLHEGNWFDELVEVPGRETPDGAAAAGLVVAHMRDQAPIHLDAIGVGSSAFDFLAKANLPVVGVNVSNSATRPDRSGLLKFANLRVQLWWALREALDPTSNLAVALPPDDKLRVELCAPEFKPEGRTLRMSSRDDIIDLIGRSPDRATAVILAWMQTPKMEALVGTAQSTMNQSRTDRFDRTDGYDPYTHIRT